MSIKLGVAPIAWSNDDMPELGGETTLEQCLHEASKAGFTGIESGGKFPKNSAELIPKLNKENLSLCSGCYGAQLLVNTAKDEFSLMKNQLKLFKDCKSPCMVFAEITNSVQGDPNTPLSKNMVNNPIILKASEKMHPVGRIGEPKDISNAIQFLIDPKNNWITGQTLSLDGGMSTTK